MFISALPSRVAGVTGGYGNVAGVTKEANFLLYVIYINLDLVACGLLATVKDTTSLYSLTPISLLPFSLNSLALILPEMAGAKSKGQSLSPHMAGTSHSCRQRSSGITLLLLKLSSLGTQDAPPSLLCLLHILGWFLVSSAAEQCRAQGSVLVLLFFILIAP